jgi:hypothetical protein
MLKKTISLFLTLLILCAPVFSLAQEETSTETEEAIAQAHKDAISDVDKEGFITMGILLNVIAVIGVSIFDSSPDPARLVGKSPEYTKAYTQAYKQKAKSQRMKYTAAGCAGSTVAIGCIAAILLTGKKALEGL